MNRSVKIIIAIIVVLIIGIAIYMISKPEKATTENKEDINNHLELKVEPDGEPNKNFLNDLMNINSIF